MKYSEKVYLVSRLETRNGAEQLKGFLFVFLE